jgi:cell division protein FtsB
MRKLILFLVILLVYLQYRLWLGDGGLLELWNVHQEVEAQREENARLRERNEALNAQVLDLKQGLGAIEERAREDMGMVKQGETFYQLVEP